MSHIAVLITVLLYVACLILIGRYFERNPVTNSNLKSLVYSLSIGAYCTAWTFFGSVEKSSYEGLSFLAVYVGPIVGSIFWRSIWTKLILIKDRYSVANIADLISIRHGKSQYLATGVTVFLVLGMIPYIALQIKAIIRSTNFLTGESPTSFSFFEGAVVVSVLLFLTVYFGLRRLNTTDRHPGLVYTSAFESLIKLASFLTVGIAVVYFIYDGFSDLFSKAEAMKAAGNIIYPTSESSVSSWISTTVLSLFAFLFLPRQFHMAVVENVDKKHLSRATWLFPLFLFLINLFVFPLALAGIMMGLEHRDLFLFEIPNAMGMEWMSFFIYLGGLSAAAGMVIVEVTTLSTMVSSNIIIPLSNRYKGLRFLSRRILGLRWMSAALILMASLFYVLIVGNSYALVSIGMISFAAIFQLVPTILGGLFWNRGSLGGAALSVLVGASFWFLTLLLPALAKSGLIPAGFLVDGYFGFAILRPEALFGIEGFDNITHFFIWSIFLGPFCYVIGSVIFPQSKNERLMASEIVDISSGEIASEFVVDSHKNIILEEKKKIMTKVMSKYFSFSEAKNIVDEVLKSAHFKNENTISVVDLARVTSLLEARLAGSIGAAQAHLEIQRLQIFNEEERKELENFYSSLLAKLNVPPAELVRKASIALRNNDQLLDEAERLQIQLVQKSKMSALGEMASGVAHEINNPLAIIKAKAQFMQRMVESGNIDSAKLIYELSKVDNTTDRISKIINSLRTFSRHSDGDPFENVDLRNLIESSLDLCHARFRANGVQLTVSEVPNVQVFCRMAQIEQVIINLLNNAHDAVLNLPDKWVRLDCEVVGAQLRIKIIDSGRGISADIVEKIMQPFFTTKPVGAGTGLGLSISKGIVELHNGKLLYVPGTPNTTFVIELPVQS